MWHRNVDEISNVYAAADVVVLSSRVEGIPLTMLEALSSGVPVVATAVGGIPELASASGVSVVQPDDYEGFAEAATSAIGSAGDEITLPLTCERETMTAAYDRIIDPDQS